MNTTDKAIWQPETRDAVKEMIEHDEYAISALVYLYTLQTEDEKSAQITIEENGKGFSASDAEFLSSVAQYYLDHQFITERQMEFVKRRIIKYGGQLVYQTFQPATIKGGEKKRSRGVPTKARKWAGITEEGRRIIIKFMFPKGDKGFQETLANVKTLSGRRWMAEDKVWKAPISMESVEKLIGWDFEIGDKLLEWYQKMIKPSSGAEIGDIPGLKIELYPFQKTGVQFIEDKDGSAVIGDEMGLGKTAEAIAWLQLHPEMRPAVIVPPATGKYHWSNKVEEWMDSEDVFVLEGYPDDPHALGALEQHQVSQAFVKKGGPIVVVNYDIIPNKEEEYDTGKVDPQTRKKIMKRREVPGTGWIEALINIKPKALILDECHYIKNSKAQRTKAIVKLAKKSRCKVIGLSGTPILSRPLEFFNIIDLCKPGLFPSWWAYAQEYCGAHNNGFGWDFSGASNLDKLHEILTKHIMIRRLKKDVMKELPEKQRTVIPLEITNRKEYNSAASDIIAWIHETDGMEAAAAAEEAKALVQFEKLKQLAVKGKMKGAVNWISNFIDSGEKLVVFCTHTAQVKALKKKFGDSAVTLYGETSAKKRNEAETRFQTDDKIRLLIGNIQAAGVVITLTASSNTCFLELGWTPGEHRQAEDRVHRIGQTADSVNAWYLLGVGTVEEEIAELLDKKQKVLDAVLDGVPADSEDYKTSLLTELLTEWREAA